MGKSVFKDNIKALVILFLVFLMPILLFILKFRDYSVSNNTSGWANFATYLSGTVGLTISIVSLLVTLFIADRVNNLEDKRLEANRQYVVPPNAWTVFI